MQQREIQAGDYSVTIRGLASADVRHPQRFLTYINELVADTEAMLLYSSARTFSEEQAWLRHALDASFSRKLTMVIAEHRKDVIGTAHAALREGHAGHVAEIGIAIVKPFRGLSLGRVLMNELIERVRIDLHPQPLSLRLSVFEGNTGAYALYEKTGFEEVARIPLQFKHQDKLVDEIIMVRPTILD